MIPIHTYIIEWRGPLIARHNEIDPGSATPYLDGIARTWIKALSAADALIQFDVRVAAVLGCHHSEIAAFTHGQLQIVNVEPRPY